MHPILFHLGSFAIYSYGVLVALAFLVGSLWVGYRARNTGENVDRYYEAIFWIIIGGFAGARLLYVFYFPQEYLHDPLRILFDRGGLVWYGGLVAGAIAGITYCRFRRLSVLRFGDIVLLPATIGLAIGRIGCFMSGCCYGKATTSAFGVQFPAGHDTFPLHVHPTQLYESAALVVFAIFLSWLYRRMQRTPGIAMGTFFIGAGLIRFVIEYFRGDGVFWVPGLFTASQCISLAGVLAGIGIISLAYRLRNASVAYPAGHRA